MVSRRENISSILFGCFLVIFGLALVFFRASFVLLLAEIIQFILIVIGLWKLFCTLILKRGEDKILPRLMALGKALLYVIFGLILANRVEFTTGWLIFFIGLYQFTVGIIGFTSYILLARDKVRNIKSQFFISLIHVLFGVTSMFGSERITNTLFRLGVYLVFIGFTYVNDGRQLITRNEKARKLRNRIRIPLPVFIDAIIPNNVLIKFNEMLVGNEDTVSERFSNKLPAKDYDEDSIVHILIQVGKTGFDKIGHVDVSYKGKVYSYGNHDIEAHIAAGAIGDGVLVVADEKLYLDFLKTRGTSVFRFGIGLTEKELEELKYELDHILKDVTPWEATTEKQKKSYIGKVLEATKGQAFKFKRGRYKTYFVLGTNCVLLADELLGNNGINLINVTGILAPGTYYDYFNKLFHTYGSNVISKMLVHPQFQEPLVEVKPVTKIKKRA